MIVHGFTEGCCFCHEAAELHEVSQSGCSETGDDAEEKQWPGAVAERGTQTAEASLRRNRTEPLALCRAERSEETAWAGKRKRFGYGGM
jgi:hypothetical protein